MKLAQKRVAALILAAGLAMGTGACGGDTTGAAPKKEAASADPTTALQNSLTAYRKGSYAVAFSAHEITGTATIDTAKKHGHMKSSFADSETALAIELLTVGPDAYVRMDMGDLAETPGLELLSGEQWMHIDLSKVENSDEYTLEVTDPDMLGLSAFLGSAQNVQSAGAGKYTGTLDFAKADDSPIGDEDITTALADKASAVPFTATLDANGQLAELVVDVPAAGEYKAHQGKMTFSGYGTAAPMAKPTGAEVVTATDLIYKMLNS